LALIARAGIVSAGILGFAGLLSGCATAEAPPGLPQIQVPNRAPLGTPGDELSAVKPPPPGADANYFRAEYGPPDFVRDETESQLWRYDGNDCALFVFLYRESDSPQSGFPEPNFPEPNPYVMRHAETNPPGEGGAVDIACLASIRNAQRPTS
jgi:hypothetical protein